MSTGSKLLFRPRLIPALATLALSALFIHLGLWQAGKADRLDAARSLHAQRSGLAPRAIGAEPVRPDEVRDARVTVEGEYEADRQFFIDNRQEGGRPGVHVITPLRIAGSTMRVLVNRGWAPWAQGRGVLPQAPPPAGRVRVTGVASVPVIKKPLLISEDRQDPHLWFAPDIARYAQQHGDAVQPVLVLQDPGDAQDTLVRNWPPPEDRVAMHRGYAWQWFGMTAVLLVFFAVASVRRSPGSGPAPDAGVSNGDARTQHPH